MSTMHDNISEAKWALTEKPLRAATVERVMIVAKERSAFASLPQPEGFAGIFSALMDKVSVPLCKYDLIAGRSVDRELTADEEAVFKDLIANNKGAVRNLILSSGHCTYSWDMLLEEGLCGLEAQVREKLCGELSEDKRIFYRSMLGIYGAISRYMQRYADEADRQGMTEVAKNLRCGALRRPDSFASALQLLWIVTMINCVYITKNPTLTVGRLDQILYPLYKSDIEKGVLTPERAKEYITDYYCKHNLIMGRGEHQVGDESNSTTFDRIFNFDAPQYLLLGGTDEQGELVANELTELFAECIVPSFKNPVVVVRYVKGMDKSRPRLWRILTEKALASSSLMFYNDGNVRSTLLRMGLPPEDTAKYAHFGCNWCSTGDNGSWMAGGPSSHRYDVYESEEEAVALQYPYGKIRSAFPHAWPEAFMQVLRRTFEEKGDLVTSEDIYRGFVKVMSDFIDGKLKLLSRELSVRKRRPSKVLTYGDCFLRGSVETGECVSASAKYHFELQTFQMFATVVDCFTVIDQLVMRDKTVTMTELLAAVDADFEGYSDVLALCRRVEKFGSDSELSNYYARKLSAMASDLVIEKSKPYLEKEGLMLTPCMQSDTWHLKMGETYGATPDGRRAGEVFSQNTRPNNGACTNGITGMFNSLLNIPSDGLVSGALNLDVTPSQFEGEEGRERFASILASYFNRGGLHAQVSVADAKTLRKAQIKPEDHRDLTVRVTGYSGIFVDMCERLQNDVINRIEGQ